MDINGPADIRWDGERVKHEKVMQFRIRSHSSQFSFMIKILVTVPNLLFRCSLREHPVCLITSI